jgi:hypothetical protein
LWSGRRRQWHEDEQENAGAADLGSGVEAGSMPGGQDWASRTIFKA